MRSFQLSVLAGLLACGSAASAAPMLVRNAKSVTVALGAKRTQAFALRAEASGGWRLQIPGLSGVLALKDVTQGAGSSSIQLTLGPAGILLDNFRFRADHAYQIEIRHGEQVVGSGVIYLRPPTRSSRVNFSDDDRLSEGPEVAIYDKGRL
jgi:hypothetical protein